MIYLTLEEILGVAARAIDGEVKLRDVGLLEAAVARPKASAFGADAYPDLHSKSAALLLSICQNHALIDGNKRLALAATIVMLGVNGWKLTLTNDEAYNLVIAVTSGELAEVAEVAEQLRNGSTLR
ncbi:MAG: type II toxin-antitoxin system death-on-curing family toxin [Actinomycetes bacterium]|nr:type II toxin-antitoxin system death-on-curing family toxin [Candidatus Nanopelagicales bacterium]